MSAGLPPVVQKYLEQHGMEAIPADELVALRQPAPPPECPYPLHRTKWGHDHRLYVGTICETDGEALSGLHVIQCEACGHVTFETPYALAAAGGGDET